MELPKIDPTLLPPDFDIEKCPFIKQQEYSKALVTNGQPDFLTMLSQHVDLDCLPPEQLTSLSELAHQLSPYFDQNNLAQPRFAYILLANTCQTSRFWSPSEAEVLNVLHTEPCPLTLIEIAKKLNALNPEDSFQVFDDLVYNRIYHINLRVGPDFICHQNHRYSLPKD
jgi:hypothetical protein